MGKSCKFIRICMLLSMADVSRALHIVYTFCNVYNTCCVQLNISVQFNVTPTLPLTKDTDVDLDPETIQRRQWQGKAC